MKVKYVLFGFIGLSLLSFLSIARADTYTLGVSAGSSQTYTVVKSGGDYTSYAQEGGTFTIEVLEVLETSVNDGQNYGDSHWELSLKISAEGKADQTKAYWISKTPTFGIAFFCPISVSDYLATADSLYDTTDSVTLSGTGYTRDSGSQTTQYTYDATTGFMTLQKITQDGEVVLEVKAGTSGSSSTTDGTSGGGIPGYELPILLSISAIFTIGIIMLKKKRM